MGRERTLTPFGKQVRIRLLELDMQQRDLAAALGISPAFLTYLLYGDRPMGVWKERIRELICMPAGIDGEMEA